MTPTVHSFYILAPSRGPYPPSHRPMVCCQLLCPSSSLATCSYVSLAFHLALLVPHLSEENQIAAATAATAEINGNWQGNLLFFQPWIMPSKHKDGVENGCCGGAGFGVV